MFRNFVGPQTIPVEEDVTCLVGKNESGKTTILKALHRLNPANGDSRTFALVTEYPRWRLASDRRKNELDEVQPVSARFALDADDYDALTEILGVRPPDGTYCIAGRKYGGILTIGLYCDLRKVIATAAESVGITGDDLGELLASESAAKAIAAAKASAKTLKDDGETARGNLLSKFGSALGQYSFVTGAGMESDKRSAVAARLPKFFYFSNYATLPGEEDLTNLAAKIDNEETLSPREETVVALLAYAGEEAQDFLDEDYESRKAELQAAGLDLSQKVFEFWRQNRDLSVTFDTDTPVVDHDANGAEIRHRFLKIELRDERHGGIETNFETRSAGFQWFFSFLAAFSPYLDSNDPVVVLLDEPGTSLHGEAQRDFVRFIHDELGQSKQVLYTTHSQHMVDPSRYEKMRAVTDEATREDPGRGVVVSLVNLAADRDTLLPVEAALGYSISQHLFLGSGHHLVVEGSSDFVFMQRVSEHLALNGRTGLDPRLAILPVGGADNIPAFVALLGRRLDVTVLVDGAKSGNRVQRIKNAAKAADVPESSIIVCSDVPGLPTNADIEDLFHVEDYLRLYNWAFSTSLTAADLPQTDQPILQRVTEKRGSEYDHALPAHALTNHRDEFFGSVKPVTLEHFEKLFELLNATI
jgi:energy-coupling factor transporter ATP-binding protein EcfA2